MSENAENIDEQFGNFIYLQAQSAGLFLGQIENPATGKKSINLQAAQSVLNSLEMLQRKVKGNLTTQETNLLEKAILNIRGLYKTVEALG